MGDPAYKPAPIPPNAFVDSSNPNAVFPQHSKPHIIDFRAHKMAMSGLASRHVFRKHFAKNSIKSKYQTIVKDEFDVAKEEEQKIIDDKEREIKAAIAAKEAKDRKIDISSDMLIEQMEKKMRISKKNRGPPVVKKIVKPEKGDLLRERKERNKNKRNRSQLKF